MATDFDKQWAAKDPILFPTAAADDVIRRWPPTLTVSAEFDNYVEANKIFIKRLAACGRLVENVTYPGSGHGYFYMLDYKMSPNYWADMK